MLRKKEYNRGREGGTRRPTPWRLSLALLTVVLLVPVQDALAVVQSTSGTVLLGNTVEYGTTAYSVHYTYPSTAAVGTNLTITVTLHVNSLTGLVEYIADYRLVADISIGANELAGTAFSADNAPFLYPGASWGPNNVTIPLTANNTGLAKGASANATVSITLGDEVYYGGGLSTYTTEPPMQGPAGSLVIQDSVAPISGSTTSQVTGQARTYLPYALLALGVVLMLSAVLLPHRPRSPPPNQFTKASNHMRFLRSESNF